MRAINQVRAAGSIAAAVEQGIITDGIMYACVKHNVPFVLTGSIRDDGPLPGVITDMLAAQDAMRRHTIKATMAILIATALHAIATGNMLPAFVQQPDGSMRELPTICVDSSEFVVSKLKDRGTHQAFGVVTNAQDFMHILRLYVEKRNRDACDAGAGRGAGGFAMTASPLYRMQPLDTRDRFLQAITAQVAADRIAEIHLFAPIRQGGVESGVAVVAAIPFEGPDLADREPRFVVYTARYRLMLKGPDRGKWETNIVADADAPLVTVDAVVRGVQRRAGDLDDPTRLDGDELRATLAGLR